MESKSHSNRELAEKIYNDLNNKGADLGNASIFIIEKSLDENQKTLNDMIAELKDDSEYNKELSKVIVTEEFYKIMSKEYINDTLHLTYRYKGTNCCIILVRNQRNSDGEVINDYIVALNDFNEVIYNGHKKHFNSFLEALKDDLFS